MQVIPINVIPRGVDYAVNASQYDKDRVFRGELKEDMNTYTLDGTEALRVRYERPDKEVGSFAVNNTGSSYLDITIPQDATEKAGLVYCKLHINEIACKAFYIIVENKPEV